MPKRVLLIICMLLCFSIVQAEPIETLDVPDYILHWANANGLLVVKADLAGTTLTIWTCPADSVTKKADFVISAVGMIGADGTYGYQPVWWGSYEEAKRLGICE